jgi:hypothetical protein
MNVVFSFSEAVMRRSNVALIPIVVSLALAACTGDRDTTAPRYIAPTRTVSADLTLACDFTTMTADAKNYAPFKDIVFTMIGDMKTLYRTSVAAATPKGFDILARVADLRRGGQQIGLAAAGGKLVLDVVGCMDVGPVGDKFTPAAALNAGVFEVRGNDEAALAATALSAAPLGTPPLAASPLWGAEPNGAWARPATAPYGRYLIYGYPIGAGASTDGFELGTLPAAVSASFATTSVAFRVGLCVPQSPNSLTANRLIHGGAIVTGAVTTDQGAAFCPATTGAISAGGKTWLASLVNKATSLFTPRAVSAQSGFFGIGGLPDGWSPFNPNALQGSGITITITQQPANTKVGSVDPVTVNVADNGLVVPGVMVSLTVAGNSGTPANAVVTSGGGPYATDSNGNATFPMTIGKAGGYTLTVNGTLSGVPTGSATSVLFNVKNP